MTEPNVASSSSGSFLIRDRTVSAARRTAVSPFRSRACSPSLLNASSGADTASSKQRSIPLRPSTGRTTREDAESVVQVFSARGSLVEGRNRSGGSDISFRNLKKVRARARARTKGKIILPKVDVDDTTPIPEGELSLKPCFRDINLVGTREELPRITDNEEKDVEASHTEIHANKHVHTHVYM